MVINGMKKPKTPEKKIAAALETLIGGCDCRRRPTG
jgi:hypothetical protein